MSGHVYVLTVIDRASGELRHLEVFSSRPSFPPAETGYTETANKIAVSMADVDGGDSIELLWHNGGAKVGARGWQA